MHPLGMSFRRKSVKQVSEFIKFISSCTPNNKKYRNQAIFRFAVQSKHFARLEKVVTFYDRLFHRKLFVKLHIPD